MRRLTSPLSEQGVLGSSRQLWVNSQPPFAHPRACHAPRKRLRAEQAKKIRLLFSGLVECQSRHLTPGVKPPLGRSCRPRRVKIRGVFF